MIEFCSNCGGCGLVDIYCAEGIATIPCEVCNGDGKIFDDYTRGWNDAIEKALEVSNELYDKRVLDCRSKIKRLMRKKKNA